MTMFGKSLAFRIFALNLFLIILPIAVFFLFFFDWEYRQKVNTDIQRLRNIALSRASYLDQFIDDQFTALNLIATLADLNKPDTLKNLEAAFKPLKLETTYPILGFLERDAANHYIVKYSSDPREAINSDLTFRGYIAPAIRNERYAYLGYDSQTAFKEFVFLKVIHSLYDYNLLGILLTVIPAQSILETLIEDKYFTDKETVSLLTEDKIVLASSDPQFVFVGLQPISQERRDQIKSTKQFGSFDVPTKTLSLKPLSNTENVFEWSNNGDLHITFIAPVANHSIYVMMDVQRSTISEHYIRTTWITIVILFSITLISCIITVLISKLLSRTFAELITVMDKVSQGDLSVRFQEKMFGYEMNKAGNTLNKVLDRLVSETKVAESEQLKTESVSKELKIGREIQKSILPQVIPHVAGLEMGVYSQPASEVSGDFYDAYMRGEKLVITLAGTSGKGLFSCLYAVSLRSLLRAVAQKEVDPGLILGKTNALFHKDLQNTPLNIKTFIGFWNSASATLQYASANPSFGFVRRANGTFEPLAGSSGNMGITAEASFTSYNLPLEPGAIVILYTGGVVDLQSASGMLYGETGLKAVVEQKNYLGAEELAKAISDDLFRFAAGAVQLEDMTVVVLKTKFSDAKSS